MSSKNRANQPRGVGVHFDGDLRRALLDAAAKALDEVGADDLSLRDVARRVGVSHAAPAHHFGDKTGLLTAVATEGFAVFIDRLGAALASDPDRPVDQLPALSRAYAEFADQHPGYFEVMFRPGLVRTEDADYDAFSTAAFDALQEHIQRCQNAGWRPDADTRTLAAGGWALAHGIAVLRSQGSLARHYPDASLDAAAEITAALIEGTPPPRRRSPASNR
ncbi:MAG: TetR/AcrR family transcriptional regulator [Acidimicrobiia bacterium]|nr:TetR/AcrR family transcriptional regulator [Acidimicrobiia bacterium]